MIHCPACGKSNADEFRFCLGCGGDLNAARDVQKTAEAAAMGTGSRDEVRAVFLEQLGRMRTGLGGSSSSHGGAATLPVVPPPPRDPSARTKGIIYAYTGTQAVMRLIGGIFTLVGVVVFGIVGHGLLFDVALAVAGKTEHGTVVDVRPDPSISFNGIHPRIVRFKSKQGRGSSSTFDLAWAESLTPGAAIDVDTIRGVPALSRVHGTMVSGLGWFACFPLIFSLVGLPLLISAVRSNRREIRAFRYGVSTVGRVTRFGLDRSATVNGRHPTILMWSFSVEGRGYTGSLTHMDGDVLAPLVDNQQVPVVYDPKNPKVNTLYVI